MNKKEKIKKFNPNDPGDKSSNIFGLPFTADESEVIFVPIPWEVTVSYHSGTAKGPDAIYEASFQVDLFDSFVKDPWKSGMHMIKPDKELKESGKQLRNKAESYFKMMNNGFSADSNEAMQSLLNVINSGCANMVRIVERETNRYLKKNKIVGLIGGDHSTPLGFIKALSKYHSSFSVLQIDAHADLRIAYEGFEYSHASIMYNALKEKSVNKLVQVGIRDYCTEEVEVMQKNKNRVVTYFDRDIKHRKYKGESFEKTVKEIISKLDKKVYLSFDIDGLDPKLCPSTGTPVAGGFEAEEVVYLIQKLVESKRTIIGFDINEVAPGKTDWDANVASRLLYKIAGLAARSNGRI